MKPYNSTFASKNQKCKMVKNISPIKDCINDNENSETEKEDEYQGKKVEYATIVNNNPRGYDIFQKISFLILDDIIINQYLYEKGSWGHEVDANCCPLMQFRPILKVEKLKSACLGILDTSHPHLEEVDQPCQMLNKLQSSFAHRSYNSLLMIQMHIKERQQLRKQVKTYWNDWNYILSKVFESHLESLKLFEQMISKSQKNEFFYFHYKKFDLDSLSHKLYAVGHNHALSELFGGDNDQNLASLYMKKKGFPTYLDARGFLDFQTALFEKRDEFNSTFVTFDGFQVPIKGKYTCFLLQQTEILPNSYYDGDIFEVMRFSINPNIVENIKQQRRDRCTIHQAIENFEYDIHSEMFIQKFYPTKFDQLQKNLTSASTSAASATSSPLIEALQSESVNEKFDQQKTQEIGQNYF